MTRMPRTSIILGLLTFLPALAVAAAAAPTATLKQKNGELNKLLKQSPPAGSPQEKAQKDDIKRLAASFIDYAELTRKAMADHWEKITPAQRTDLVGTLKDLIERNYVKQVRTNVDYRISYDDESVSGDQATVHSTVKVKTKGKSTDAEIVYQMRKVASTGGDAWLVWDVITDESSLMRTYKSQFNKLITEQGFDPMLKKMKDKLKEKDKETDKEKSLRARGPSARALTRCSRSRRPGAPLPPSPSRRCPSRSACEEAL